MGAAFLAFCGELGKEAWLQLAVNFFTTAHVDESEKIKHMDEKHEDSYEIIWACLAPTSLA
ncbi:unnamed protein product [Dovyalis caffra]|uniref:Uncharacterized protein n=1 Tax=Dovyalis caffra TaxID=77055 RepID=A0AAV1R542_9ROSI|nr:unnamed protein product [Dovyalis caffra]